MSFDREIRCKLKTKTMIPVKFYTKAGCHLCEEALADLEALQGDIPHKLEIIDIDQQPNLPPSLQVEIPVVEVGPYRLKAPFTRQELAITLGAARDRQAQIDTPKRHQVFTLRSCEHDLDEVG